MQWPFKFERWPLVHVIGVSIVVAHVQQVGGGHSLLQHVYQTARLASSEISHHCCSVLRWAVQHWLSLLLSPHICALAQLQSVHFFLFP